MNHKLRSLFFTLLFLSGSPLGRSQDRDVRPVTPNASPEAKALLKFMVSISGKFLLTGQHNFPNIKDRNTRFAAGYIGRTPAVWSTDMGFAEDGDTDSYLARPDIVEEAKRQHRLGSIVTICWHAVPPTADEPVTFRPGPGAKPDSLASVQGQLLDRQFRDILTPGTRLYKRWCAQVDSVAFYLKKLQDAGIPVLWRPYHEMNGNWFWWGGRRGEYSSRALYLQLFNRFVNHHKLKNLVWVWSVDRFHNPEMQFSHYYPGNEYLDVLALDVYGNDFKQTYYDSLLAISNGKLLILGEVGNPPSAEIRDSQPAWGLYVVWAGMVRNTLKRQYQALIGDPRVLFLEDSDYEEAVRPFRAACGLPPLKLGTNRPPFSGEWIFNEERSTLDNLGTGSIPYRLNVTLDDNALLVKRTQILEFADDEVTEETLQLDGSEAVADYRGSTRVTTAKWSDDGKTLQLDSKITYQWGNRSFENKSRESWQLLHNGSILSVEQSSTTFSGERKITLIYDKIR